MNTTPAIAGLRVKLQPKAKADPPDLKAAALRDQVLAGESSAHVAALAMGWRKRRILYHELVSAWRKADHHQRDTILAYLDAYPKEAARPRFANP